MIVGKVATRFGSAVACAALSLSLVVSGTAAQTYGPAGGSGSSPQTSAQAPTSGSGAGSFVVKVESGISGSGVAGNMTVSGVAVDCSTGRGATRVAIYDGVDGTYVADVSMDTSKNISSYCPGMTGNGRIGFTLIYDSRRLDNGRHTLALTAEFPGGAKATGTAALYVDNNSFTADNSQYQYFDYYGYGSGLFYGWGGSNAYYGGLSYTPYLRSPFTGYGSYVYPPSRGYLGNYQVPFGGFNRYVYPYMNYAYYNWIPPVAPYAPPAYFPPVLPTAPVYSIILNQAGLTVPRAPAVPLSGIVACSAPGTSSVSVIDVTGTGRTLIATVATTSSYSVNWNTAGLPPGGRLIQVLVSGPCGSQAQTFNVTVL